MDIQYKPSKPKKEKPVKIPKAPKAENAVKFNSSVQKVKSSKLAKAPKAPKAPKPEKAQTMIFGKVQTEKPTKVGKSNASGLFTKVNPKLVICGVLALIAAVAAVLLWVIIPGMEDNGEAIKEISVSKLPEKTVYLQGESADYDGLRVTVTRNNGETFTIRAELCTITGFDTSTPADKRNVTVSYEGCTDTFSIKVLEHEKPDPVLKSISLDPMPKTKYKVGEWLDTSGAVMVREYKDGSVVRVNLMNTDVYGWGQVKGPGTYILTVKYAENGVLCTFDYTITVTE